MSNGEYQGIDSSGKSQTPDAYRTEFINFINYRGQSLDIQHLITEFTIRESIYYSSLTCEFKVQDSRNILQQHKVRGQERVHIRLLKREPDDRVEQEINLMFYVTEYPAYGKGRNDSMQAFTFTGVSEHFYLSNISKVSFSYNDNVINVIKNKILMTENGLNIPQNKLNCNVDKCKTIAKGIIPMSEPIDAAEKLLAIARDDNKSPFFMYETLDGMINIQSLSTLTSEIDNKTYKEYVRSTFDSARTPSQSEDISQSYYTNRHRILTVSSDLKLSTLEQMKAGAYVAHDCYLDISNKEYRHHEYDYSADFDLNKTTREVRQGGEKYTNRNISKEFTVKNKSLFDYKDASNTYVSANNLLYDETDGYTKQREIGEIQARSHFELLETQTHDIDLNGDFRLNAGKAIRIILPRAMPLENQKELLGDENAVDESMSGRFIITGVEHVFRRGSHLSRCRIKRDVVNIKE